MTNAELAVYLNAELGLVGTAAVTSHVIRQWVLWDLLPKAAGRGRGRGQGLTWERSERDLRRARQLATWRAYGVRRETALIVHAYVAWGYRDWERVRDALIAELTIARAAIRKRLTANLDFERFEDVAAVRKKAFRNQLGPLDPRLKNTAFELTPELYGLAGQALLSPGLAIGHFPQSIAAAIKTILPNVAPLSDTLSRIFSLGVEGLFAFEDETDTAAIPAIERLDRFELRRARILLRTLTKARGIDRRSIRLPEPINLLFDVLDGLGSGITMGHWLITSLAIAGRLSQAKEIASVNSDINPELLRELGCN